MFVVVGCGTMFILNPAGMYAPFLIGLGVALLLGVLFSHAWKGRLKDPVIKVLRQLEVIPLP